MPLRFAKVLIADTRFESAGAFDVNGNGAPDIVCGEWWYEGPQFDKRHRIGSVQAVGDYFDDFSTIPMDVNGDGRMDYITCGWWSGTLRWRENPGDPLREWPEHVIAECGPTETTRAWDVDGDGQPELVPSTPGGPLVAYRLVTDAHRRGTGRFAGHTLWAGPQGHGLGCGDISGNGRMDFVFAGGWLEAPEDPWHDEWRFHAELKLGSASIPIIVADVNGDGLGDLIVGQAHGYGLDWWEQGRDRSGRRSWTRHPIDPFTAGFHDLQWVDIDRDGEPELVTGKRYWAHCGADAGEYDDLGIYYYKWTGEGFAKQIIDWGPIRAGTGCGLHFATADLRGTGRLDVVAPGKDGLYVFYNQGA